MSTILNGQKGGQIFQNVAITPFAIVFARREVGVGSESTFADWGLKFYKIGDVFYERFLSGIAAETRHYETLNIELLS